MTQKQTASIAASWRDHPIGIQAEGLEVEELSFPAQSKKKGKVELRIESNRSDCLCNCSKGLDNKISAQTSVFISESRTARDTNSHFKIPNAFKSNSLKKSSRTHQ